VNGSDEVKRAWRIEKWEKAWLAVCLAVLLGLVARVALVQADRVRAAAAFYEPLAAPFENPACAPFLKVPVEQLPRLENLGAGNACSTVIDIRRGRHARGEATEVTADEFRPSRWELVQRFCRLHVDSVHPFLLAMAFLPSLYGVGLIAARLWRRGARCSARDGAAPN